MKQVKLYIMSLWILFVLVIVATLDIPIYFGENPVFVGWGNILTPNNSTAFICMILISLGLLFYYQFNRRLNGSPDGLPLQLIKLDNINYEYVSLFMTLISVIAFDFKTIRGAILFALVILILGAIFIKTEIFYSNPSFALLGYYIYRVSTNHNEIIPDNSILISRGKLRVNERVDYLKISDSVFYCQKSKIK